MVSNEKGSERLTFQGNGWDEGMDKCNLPLSFESVKCGESTEIVVIMGELGTDVNWSDDGTPAHIFLDESDVEELMEWLAVSMKKKTNDEMWREVNTVKKTSGKRLAGVC